MSTFSNQHNCKPIHLKLYFELKHAHDEKFIGLERPHNLYPEEQDVRRIYLDYPERASLDAASKCFRKLRQYVEEVYERELRPSHPIHRHHKTFSVVFRYRDDDRDWVNVTNDREWYEAIALHMQEAKHISNNVLSTPVPHSLKLRVVIHPERKHKSPAQDVKKVKFSRHIIRKAQVQRLVLIPVPPPAPAYKVRPGSELRANLSEQIKYKAAQFNEMYDTQRRQIKKYRKVMKELASYHCDKAIWQQRYNRVIDDVKRYHLTQRWKKIFEELENNRCKHEHKIRLGVVLKQLIPIAQRRMTMRQLTTELIAKIKSKQAKREAQAQPKKQSCGKLIIPEYVKRKIMEHESKKQRSLPPVPVPPPAPVRKVPSEPQLDSLKHKTVTEVHLETLNKMGFINAELNATLLKKYHNNLQKTVIHLLDKSL